MGAGDGIRLRVTELPEAAGERLGSVDRALVVLEALVHHGPKASLATVAASAGLPKPTTHRILQILATHGYALQIEGGLYMPGLRILRLAARLQETLDVAEFARPLMRELQQILPETVHFAVLHGDQAVYVEKLEGRGAVRMASTIGTALALHSTAIGKAILAVLPDDECRERLASPLSPRTNRTITSPETLRYELERIRERGYAVDDEENEEHVRCVGAAVIDHSGHVIGGLSLSAPAFALTLPDAHALGPKVMASAAQLSLSLGARPDQLPPPYPSVELAGMTLLATERADG